MELEEQRNKIGEILGDYKDLRDEMGKVIGEIDDLMESGELMSHDNIPKIALPYLRKIQQNDPYKMTLGNNNIRDFSRDIVRGYTKTDIEYFEKKIKLLAPKLKILSKARDDRIKEHSDLKAKINPAKEILRKIDEEIDEIKTEERRIEYMKKYNSDLHMTSKHKISEFHKILLELQATRVNAFTRLLSLKADVDKLIAANKKADVKFI